MNGKDNQAGQTDALRQRAEEIIRQQAAQSPASETISSEEIQKILHELCVHQIELEMQNEELRQSKLELHASQTRYFELYDLAPAGYCTISGQGMILEANLAAAGMLGMGRNALARQPFSRFILKADHDIYYRHRQQLMENGEPQACELRMLRKDGTAFWGHLAVSTAQDTYGNPELRIVLSDITERKFQEEAGELTTRLIILVNSPSSSFRERMAELTAALQGWSGCEAVGIRLRDGNDFPYFETHGFPSEFVEIENHLCAYDKNGELLRDSAGNPVLECMCGNILSGRFDSDKPFFTPRGSFWTNSTTALLASTSEASRQSRTRNRCNTEGYESVALIPLRNGHQIFGLLQFNDRRLNCFSPGLIEHFEKMADSLAIALAQRQSEEALHIDQENLQAIFAAAPTGMILIDETAMIVNSNAVIARLVCRDHALVIRQRIGTGLGCAHSVEHEKGCGFSPSCPECPLSKGIQQVLKSGNSIHGAEMEYTILADGQQQHFWLSVNAEPVLLEGRKHVIVAIDDISERKRMETSLRESEERYAMILAAVNDGFWDWHIPSGNAFFSTLYYTILGCEDREFPATYDSWRLLVHPDDIDRVERDLQTSIKTGEGFAIDLRMRTKSGEWLWVSIRGKAIELDASSKALRMVGTLSDITVRKQAEDLLREKIDELQRFQKLTVNRELVMIELKKEVNELLIKNGLEEKYRIIDDGK